MLGVLGGMGPLAGADFVSKLIRATPVDTDAAHIPLLLWSVPQVPDRLAAMEGRGESPVPMLVHALRSMAACGVDRVAIACNTVHYWYDELVAGGGLPILHIADAASEALSPPQIVPTPATSGPGRRIALLATRGTHAAGFYPLRLAAFGHRVLAHDEALQLFEAYEREWSASAGATWFAYLRDNWLSPVWCSLLLLSKRDRCARLFLLTTNSVELLWKNIKGSWLRGLRVADFAHALLTFVGALLRCGRA